MIGTTQLVILGVIAFLLFGGVLFKRGLKQIVEAKKEVHKAFNDLETDDSKLESKKDN